MALEYATSRPGSLGPARRTPSGRCGATNGIDHRAARRETPAVVTTDGARDAPASSGEGLVSGGDCDGKAAVLERGDVPGRGSSHRPRAVDAAPGAGGSPGRDGIGEWPHHRRGRRTAG